MICHELHEFERILGDSFFLPLLKKNLTFAQTKRYFHIMLKKNNLYIGLGIGILLPIVGYAILLTIFEQLDALHWTSQQGLSFKFRTRTLAMIAICVNLIPVQIYQRLRANEIVRGLSITTVAMAMIWLFTFGKDIL
jgi:hypothetical protein